MTDLNELLERVKAATGPDREIDVALLHLWDPDHEALRSYDERYQIELRDGVFSVWKTDGGYSASVPFPRFTASIDAALALVGRVLPGWNVQFGTLKSGGARARVALDWPEVAPLDECYDAPTAPLAILAALLLSLTKERTNVQ